MTNNERGAGPVRHRCCTVISADGRKRYQLPLPDANNDGSSGHGLAPTKRQPNPPNHAGASANTTASGKPSTPKAICATPPTAGAKPSSSPRCDQEQMKPKTKSPFDGMFGYANGGPTQNATRHPIPRC